MAKTPTGKFGDRAGLPERLDYWVDRLGTDRTLNFPGLGLIEDLKAARLALIGAPERKDKIPMEFDL